MYVFTSVSFKINRSCSGMFSLVINPVIKIFCSYCSISRHCLNERISFSSFIAVHFWAFCQLLALLHMLYAISANAYSSQFLVSVCRYFVLVLFSLFDNLTRFFTFVASIFKYFSRSDQISFSSTSCRLTEELAIYTNKYRC